VRSNDLEAADIGDITVGASGSVDIDADAVGAAELADDAVVKASLSAVDYGCFTAGTDGTTTLDDDAVNSNNIAAGDFGDITVAANGTMTVDASALNVIVATNASAEALAASVVATNASAVATAASIVATNASANASASAILATNYLGSVFGSVTVATAPVSPTQATITVTCKDITGATLATAKTFPFWFTAPGQSTTPSESGIESWSYVTHGDLKANLDLGIVSYPGTNYVRVGQTHTDGTMDFLVTSVAAGWTNGFSVLGPNGSFTNETIKYITP
jgi:hypothetical protein